VSFLDLAREGVLSYITGRFCKSMDKHTQDHNFTCCFVSVWNLSVVLKDKHNECSGEYWSRREEVTEG
jgi:hypothetical protein